MITINSLTFRYQKNQALFSNLNMKCQQGSIVGLLGKNGAGKSTLLNLMNGFIAPQEGEIQINGYQPFDRLPAFLADTYMVPEEFSFPGITIATYIKACAPFYPNFDYQKLEKILIEFDLKEDNNLNKLSHGQRKKFLIAFALASNCKLLLLDEPTNGLDIPSKSQFRKILVSSISDEQLVIISTHQVKDIDTVIDKVIVMNNGQITYNQDINEIMQSLSFETATELKDEATIFYFEKNPIGYRIIRKATKDNDTVIDLELLFNGVINQSVKQ